MLETRFLRVHANSRGRNRGNQVSFGVSYMGTKRHLIPALTDVLSGCRNGVFLDLFSGMCTVGRSVAPSRQVWSNDLQAFSHLVAKTQFCSADTPISRHAVPGLVSRSRLSNLEELRAKFSDLFVEEEKALHAKDVSALASMFDKSVVRAQSLSDGVSRPQQYDLFTSRFGGTYFSYEQAAEIDSVRCAIDALKCEGKISEDQWSALLVALCAAMSKCANSTGHFAQALYPKNANLKKIVAQRRRSVWHEWMEAIDRVFPVGGKDWRRKNQSFQADAIDLLKELPNRTVRPSVVYADPPYTQDQYSRYYHIYETAVLYDYPSCQGKGLYRPNRISSPFSLASKVEEALDQLVESASRLKSCLILSYPKDGLLKQSDQIIPSIIKRHFGVEPTQIGLPHRHSTMGASKGRTSHDVTEMIYRVIT